MNGEQAVRSQDAQAMYYQGRLERRAAVISEMALSTFTHRMAGRIWGQGDMGYLTMTARAGPSRIKVN